jgi:hypothetical protein
MKNLKKNLNNQYSNSYNIIRVKQNKELLLTLSRVSLISGGFLQKLNFRLLKICRNHKKAKKIIALYISIGVQKSMCEVFREKNMIMICYHDNMITFHDNMITLS